MADAALRGVDTTIILVAVASLFFAVALSTALLAGLGGRPIPEQIAAGRAIRQELNIGDRSDRDHRW